MNRIIPVFLFSAVLLLGLSGTALAGKPEFAKKNQPSYWGNCYKLEIDGDVQKYTVTDPDAVKVIVKGGRYHKVYTDGPFENLTAAYNKRSGKTYGISHVTICTDDVQDEDDDKPVKGDKDKIHDNKKHDHKKWDKKRHDKRDDCKDKPQPKDDDDDKTPVIDIDESDNDQPQVLADTDEPKPETLPATGSPVLVNALLGGTISSAAGYLHLMSRRQTKRIKEIEEIAL